VERGEGGQHGRVYCGGDSTKETPSTAGFFESGTATIIGRSPTPETGGDSVLRGDSGKP